MMRFQAGRVFGLSRSAAERETYDKTNRGEYPSHPRTSCPWARFRSETTQPHTQTLCRSRQGRVDQQASLQGMTLISRGSLGPSPSGEGAPIGADEGPTFCCLSARPRRLLCCLSQARTLVVTQIRVTRAGTRPAPTKRTNVESSACAGAALGVAPILRDEIVQFYDVIKLGVSWRLGKDRWSRSTDLGDVGAPTRNLELQHSTSWMNTNVCLSRSQRKASLNPL